MDVPVTGSGLPSTASPAHINMDNCSPTQPSLNAAVSVGTPTALPSQLSGQELDPQAGGDRSGLAVRLVRKTRTNFLLSSSKKSRKSKAVPLSEPIKQSTEEVAAVCLSGSITEEPKREKHAKTKSHTDKPKTRSSLRKKSARSSKTTSSDGCSRQHKDPQCKPVFGVPLHVAYERSPSHDGVPLPAFFRHCIDYVEQYGLSSEGLYRVPGVNSQIQALVTALNKGEDFLRIPPTSPSYYQSSEGNVKYPTVAHSTHPSTVLQSSDAGAKTKHQTHTGHADHSSKGAASISSPKRHRSVNIDNRTGPFSAQPRLPHDLAVICSVIKYFVRSLPEPVLTNSLVNVMESVSAAAAASENPSVAYIRLAHLVHQDLPRQHRYLLAWLLQHVTHIIDRAGENLMTQANIIIVLSPCMGMSHRLLSILLGPAPPDVHIDLTQLDSGLPEVNLGNINVDPSTWHWLFPHSAYLLRAYRPPMRPGPDLELPDTNEELDTELQKQESLLSHLHEQIGRGDTSAEKEAFLWEVQRLVTEIRRRKTLVDPEAIRAELFRQQAQLDRLHRAIAQNSVDRSKSDSDSVGFPFSAQMEEAQPVGVTSDAVATHRRRPTAASKSHTEPVSSYSDELWEVQRQVTMLKRRLKQQEKLAANQARIPSTATTANQNTAQSNSLISPSGIPGGVPLFIPSLSELDEEEVLNLTLRKLPLDATPLETNTDITPSSTAVSLPSTVQPINSASIDVANSNLDDRIMGDSTQPNEMVISVTEALCEPESASVPGSQTPVLPVADKFSLNNVVLHLTNLTSGDAKLTTDSKDIDVLADEKPTAATEGPTLELVGSQTPSPASACLNEADSNVVQTQQSVAPVPSISLSRGSLYQMALYDARKQELCAIQADLRARIRSEQAEIRQIQCHIDHLLQTGGSRVRRIYEAQFAPQDPCLSTVLGWREQASRMEHASVWLARSWTKFADRLNADDMHSPDEREICLMDESDGSEDASSGESHAKVIPHPPSIGDAQSAARKTTPVLYTRLIDNDDEDGDRLGEPRDHEVLSHDSLIIGNNTTSVTERFNNHKRFQHDHLFDKSDVHNNISDGEDVDAVIVDDDDDDDDDEEAGEAELARTLHQLTLDNARLEQLNIRYLEGIQAERNRCAELKVLLKLRNIRNLATPLKHEESFIPVNYIANPS